MQGLGDIRHQDLNDSESCQRLSAALALRQAEIDSHALRLPNSVSDFRAVKPHADGLGSHGCHINGLRSLQAALQQALWHVALHAMGAGAQFPSQQQHRHALRSAQRIAGFQKCHQLLRG